MSWLDEAKLTTANDKLMLRMERNRQKAAAKQAEAIQKCEDAEKKVKYGIGADYASNKKKDIKDYIVALQAIINNPPTDEEYEPPVMPK